MKRRYTKRAPYIVCPHCDGPAVIRRSEQITATVRELNALCDNDKCGCRFVAQIVAVRTIQPSLRPNAAIMLPLSVRPIMRVPSLPANDDARIPANDDRCPAAEADPLST